MLIRTVSIVALLALPHAGCGTTQPVTRVEAACALATARVTAQNGLPTSHVAFCDDIAEADRPTGYYVMALRARCSEELCGSTNIGWFAVQKTTGDVFEVDDVTDWTLGRRVPEVRTPIPDTPNAPMASLISSYDERRHQSRTTYPGTCGLVPS